MQFFSGEWLHFPSVRHTEELAPFALFPVLILGVSACNQMESFFLSDAALSITSVVLHEADMILYKITDQKK